MRQAPACWHYNSLTPTTASILRRRGGAPKKKQIQSCAPCIRVHCILHGNTLLFYIDCFPLRRNFVDLLKCRTNTIFLLEPCVSTLRSVARTASSERNSSLRGPWDDVKDAWSRGGYIERSVPRDCASYLPKETLQYITNLDTDHLHKESFETAMRGHRRR